MFILVLVAQHRKKLQRYNSWGHAHELTWSCYRSREYFIDPSACELLLGTLAEGKALHNYCVWAYVIMPTHVHLLIWPRNTAYDIAAICGGIKNVMSKRYRKRLEDSLNAGPRGFLVRSRGEKVFRFWQPGGGFDRNLWNAKAIHDSINYIEANPVRKGLVAKPDEWQWSSASARKRKVGLVPDYFQLPVLMLNPQRQRIGTY
jgi:putative transposase